MIDFNKPGLYDENDILVASCDDLEELRIIEGGHVTTLSGSRIKNWPNGTKLILPEKISVIDAEAFVDCEQLTFVYMPDCVTTVHTRAFDNCNKLEEIVLSKNLTIIATDTFSYCESLKSIELGDKINRIKTYAFYHCNSLETVVFPDSLQKIEEFAFADCLNLKNVSFSNKGDKLALEKGIFCETAIENIILPNCKSLDAMALENMPQLKAAFIFGSNCMVYDSIFWRCPNVKEAYIDKTAKLIEDDIRPTKVQFNRAGDYLEALLDMYGSVTEANRILSELER